MSDDETDAYFLLGLFAINGSAIIAANIQAYRARKITTEFSESKYIGVAMACILQATLIGVPVFFFSTDPAATYLIKAGCMLVLCGSILYLIFIPKVRRIALRIGTGGMGR